jgi:hypothetical protein
MGPLKVQYFQGLGMAAFGDDFNEAPGKHEKYSAECLRVGGNHPVGPTGKKEIEPGDPRPPGNPAGEAISYRATIRRIGCNRALRTIHTYM